MIEYSKPAKVAAIMFHTSGVETFEQAFNIYEDLRNAYSIGQPFDVVYINYNISPWEKLDTKNSDEEFLNSIDSLAQCIDNARIHFWK